ncbi:MAG: hypothetical protein Q7R95_09780 [bacterium]|nr:hypothetical protein [bacterium]
MKKMVFLSDTHVGSKYGIMPEEYNIFGENQIVKASIIQRELLKKYESVVDDWKKPDILVLNGDIIDGKAKKDYSSSVWTNSFYDQVGAAVELIKMFKAKKIYVIRGTEYHVSIEGEPAEELLGERLNAVKSKGCYSLMKRYITPKDTSVSFQVSHSIGTTRSFMYRATAITREIAMMMLNASHEHKADVIIRGHAHYAWCSGSPGHMGFILPGWQLQTPFMCKISASGAIPDIGALRFEVEKDNFNYEWKTFKCSGEKPEMEYA